MRIRGRVGILFHLSIFLRFFSATYTLSTFVVGLVVAVAIVVVVVFIGVIYRAQLQHEHDRHHKDHQEHNDASRLEIHRGLLDPIKEDLDVPGGIEFSVLDGTAGHGVDPSHPRLAVHKGHDEFFGGTCVDVREGVDALLEGHRKVPRHVGQVDRLAHPKERHVGHEQVDGPNGSRRDGRVDGVPDLVGVDKTRRNRGRRHYLW
jgi:hypothetical protein